MRARPSDDVTNTKKSPPSTMTIIHSRESGRAGWGVCQGRMADNAIIISKIAGVEWVEVLEKRGCAGLGFSDLH
jgi:hypothetical protein